MLGRIFKGPSGDASLAKRVNDSRARAKDFWEAQAKKRGFSSVLGGTRIMNYIDTLLHLSAIGKVRGIQFLSLDVEWEG